MNWETLISECGLKTMAVNALSNEGIMTIGAAREYGRTRLLRLPGIGKKGVNEVMALVAGLMEEEVAANPAPLMASDATLRDWFAGQALNGMVSNPHNEREVTFARMAKDAYIFADAMLEARNQPTENPHE